MNYTLALVQAAFPFGDKPNNLAKAEGFLREAASKGADFICLPESFDIGYSSERIKTMMKLAEPLEQNTSVRTIGTLAKELGIFILAPVFLRVAADHVENAAILINDEGAIVGSYSKTHLVPGAELDCITPGHSYPVFETKYGRIGMMICNDLTAPEPARMLGIQGADVILIPSAWRSISSWATHWTSLLPARAIDNQAVVAALNHVGTTDSDTYSGETLICDTDGIILQMAGKEEENILYAEIDIERIRRAKKEFSSFYTGRMVDDYGLLCQRDMFKSWGNGWLY